MVKFRKIILTNILIVIGIFGIAGLSSANEKASTPAFKDNLGNVVPNSIASVEKINLGGINQYIVIRGKDKNKPVLLFLHGGPGGAHSPFIKFLQTRELEENFVVVQWDQRGAGKSYSKDLTKEDMRVENFITDTIELTNHLRVRFDQEKIFMIGHSWGSALGFLTIGRKPELYHAYIGAGEAADWNKRQQISFDWTYEKANTANDHKALAELEAILPFDPTDRSDISVKDKWLAAFGGYFQNKEIYMKVRNYLGKAPELEAGDVDKFMAGLGWSSSTTNEEAVHYGYSLFRDLPKVDIPIYFFAGRHDYQTPGILAEKYYKMVDAPKKGFIWFENSGHLMTYSETDKMTRELIKIAKETLQ